MKLKQFSILFVVALLAFGGGFGIRAATHTQSNTAADGQPLNTDFPLLAKRIFAENPNDALINFAPLRNQLEEYVTKNNLKGSIYYEYLPTGVSARITAEDEQVAASLMKLPAAMDAFRAVEMGKITLDQEITLQENWLDASYGNLYKKGPGYTLTFGEAIRIMLVDSDNTALKAVGFTTLNLLNPTEGVLQVVDVDITQNSNLTVSIGARSYGSFLKCLYFACFNNREDSNLILTYLSESKFDNRLMAGISDSDIVVAHKIGVYDSVQSDCGIVYIPNRQYLLCIMLKGTDSDETNNHIAQISKLTFDYVQNLQINR